MVRYIHLVSPNIYTHRSGQNTMAEILENVLRELGLSMLIPRFTEAKIDTVEVAKPLSPAEEIRCVFDDF